MEARQIRWLPESWGFLFRLHSLTLREITTCLQRELVEGEGLQR